MVRSTQSKDEVLEILSVIPDPEIPVVSIREMGMLRDVLITDDGYEVILTPTYTGCPAMGIIEQDIKMTLDSKHVFPVKVKLVFDPAWTTDWISSVAKRKLREYGIAPPVHSSCNLGAFEHNIIQCPQCNSSDTVLLSRFGSTACKSLYKCNSCKEPFEYFKCH